MIWDLELTTGLIHFRSTKQQQNAANQAPPTLLCHFAARFQKQSNWNLLSSWLELLASSHWYVAPYCTCNDEWRLIFRNVGSTPAKYSEKRWTMAQNWPVWTFLKVIWLTDVDPVDLVDPVDPMDRVAAVLLRCQHQRSLATDVADIHIEAICDETCELSELSEL